MLQSFKNKYRSKEPKTTQQQKQVLDYFCTENGRFSKCITDSDYAQLVKKKRDSYNLFEKALTKFDLNENTTWYCPPDVVDGYMYENSLVKKCGDGSWLSSTYQVTWLLFTFERLYVYCYTFSLVEEAEYEVSDTFYWRDIIQIAVKSRKEMPSNSSDHKIEVISDKLCITALGREMFVAINASENAEATIWLVKTILRGGGKING